MHFYWVYCIFMREAFSPKLICEFITEFITEFISEFITELLCLFKVYDKEIVVFQT